MRKIAIVVISLAASLSAAVASAGDPGVSRLSAGGGLSVVLPRGWHLARDGVGPSQGNRASSVQPAVIASFAVAFDGHPCPCARPNYRTCGVWCKETRIRDFSSAGALVFVWEFSPPRNSAALGRGFTLRPARFQVAQRNPHFATALADELRGLHRRVGEACVEGPGSLPSWWSDFSDSGRVFQIEVYLGPAAGSAVRARADALLNSLEIAPMRSS